MAALLGHDADATEYRELAADIKAAFNAAFYNSQLGRYTSQGSSALRVRRRLRRRSRSTRAWCPTGSAGASSTRWSS